MYEHFEWNRDKIKILLENVIEKIVKYNKKEVFMSNLGENLKYCWRCSKISQESV